MPQCAGCSSRVHRVLPSLECQQARSLLKGSGGSDSSAVGALLSLEMCLRGTLKNDPRSNLVNKMMFKSTVACVYSHNGHFVLSGEEVVCILFIIMRNLLLCLSVTLIFGAD